MPAKYEVSANKNAYGIRFRAYHTLSYIPNASLVKVFNYIGGEKSVCDSNRSFDSHV